MDSMNLWKKWWNLCKIRCWILRNTNTHNDIQRFMSWGDMKVISCCSLTSQVCNCPINCCCCLVTTCVMRSNKTLSSSWSAVKSNIAALVHQSPKVNETLTSNISFGTQNTQMTWWRSTESTQPHAVRNVIEMFKWSVGWL